MVDYYAILEVNRNATAGEIKNAYRKLAFQYHPDKNPGNRVAEQKMQEITEANTVLSDPRTRKLYDMYGGGWKEHDGEDGLERYTCAKCRVEINGKKWVNGMANKFFCTEKHARDYLDKKNGKKKNERCRSCESIHNENTEVPPKCEQILNAISKLEYLTYWNLFSPSEKKDFEEEVKSARHYYFPSEDFEGQINRTLKKANALNTQKKNAIDQERNQYIQQLKNLDGWNLLSDEKRKYIIEEEIKKCHSADQFRLLLQTVKKAIAKLQGKDDSSDSPPDDNGGDNNFWQQFNQEIEKEANQDPKVGVKDFSPEIIAEWNRRIHIVKEAGDLSDLARLKRDILLAIRTKRGGKVRLATIEKIKSKLAGEPKIEVNELNNPNWEAELNALTEKEKIEKLRDEILADIKIKREAKQVDSKLDQLISEAAQIAANNQDWKKLKELLEKINGYQNSAIYESKKGIIEELEQKLATDDFSGYQEMTANSVDEFLKSGVGIETSELDPENQNYQDLIKQAKTPAEAEQIKERVINDGGTKKATKVTVNLLAEAKTADTNEKKSAIRQKIALLKNGNKWEKAAYEKYQSEFEKITAAWAKEADSQFGNNTTPANSGPDKGLPRPLIIFLIVVVVGIILTGLLIIRNKLKKN